MDSRLEYVPLADVIANIDANCTSIPTQIEKDGSVTFYVRFIDASNYDVYNFDVENENCIEIENAALASFNDYYKNTYKYFKIVISNPTNNVTVDLVSEASE